MTKTNGTTIWRIQQLEKDFGEVGDKVDKILINHLPHIHEEIQALKVRVNLGITINIVLMIAGVLGVILLIK